VSVPTTSHNAGRTEAPRRRSRRLRALTVLTAGVTAVLGWAVCVPLIGLDLTVRLGAASSPQHVGAGAVAVAALVAGLGGWAWLGLLERATSSARRVWTGTALAALAVSMTGPLAGQTPETVAALASLHLLVAVVVVIGLRRSASSSGSQA